MADTNAKNLLRDLASAARRDQETRIMSPARALRLGLARAAAQLLELPLQVRDVTSADVSLDALADALPGDMLLVLLDGPDGARGAVGLDRALVASLIEVQTMGTVSSMEVSDRRLTPTDAAMMAPWLDAALEKVDVALAQNPPSLGGKDHGWIVGYRFGAMAEDARALVLALDSPDFHLLRLKIDVALGRRTGDMVLLLPAAPPVETSGPASPAAPRETFLAVPAELRVIAARLSLPLDRAGALRPGDVVPLGTLMFDAAELRAVDGKLAGKARLGRLGEHWAVRFAGALPERPGDAVNAPPASPPMPSSPKMDELPPPVAEPELPEPAMPDLPALIDDPGGLPDLPPLDFDDLEGGGAAPADLPDIGKIDAG